MEEIELGILLFCACAGIVMFGFGVWFLVGGLAGLRVAWTHIKDLMK